MSQCPVIDIAQKEMWARRATTASICIAALLIAIKAVGWFLTDSVSLLSSMVDSMLSWRCAPPGALQTMITALVMARPNRWLACFNVPL